MRYADGDTYEGEWLADRRHGDGKMAYADGRIPWGVARQQAGGTFIGGGGAAIVKAPLRGGRRARRRRRRRRRGAAGAAVTTEAERRRPRRVRLCGQQRVLGAVAAGEAPWPRHTLQRGRLDIHWRVDARYEGRVRRALDAGRGRVRRRLAPRPHARRGPHVGRHAALRCVAGRRARPSMSRRCRRPAARTAATPTRRGARGERRAGGGFVGGGGGRRGSGCALARAVTGEGDEGCRGAEAGGGQAGADVAARRRV